MNLAEDVVAYLSRKRFSLANEKGLQLEIADDLAHSGWQVQREVTLSQGNIVDFMVEAVAVEVKIKGSRRAIFHQCERYCEHDSVAALILVSNVAMGFPQAIAGKPCFVLNLSRAWL